MLRGQSGFTKTAEHPYKKEVHHTAGCLLPLVLCPDSILKLKMASGYGKRRRSLIHPGFIAAGCTVFQMTTEWQTLLMGTGNTNTKCSSFGQKGEAAINRGPALHLGTCKNCKFPGYAVGTTPTLHHTADWSCSQVTRVYAHQELGKIPSGRVTWGIIVPYMLRLRYNEILKKTHRDPKSLVWEVFPTPSPAFPFFRNASVCSPAKLSTWTWLPWSTMFFKVTLLLPEGLKFSAESRIPWLTTMALVGITKVMVQVLGPGVWFQTNLHSFRSKFAEAGGAPICRRRDSRVNDPYRPCSCVPSLQLNDPAGFC